MIRSSLTLTPRLAQDLARWDRFVTGSPFGHLLQSWGWGELKARFGWQAERLAVERNGDVVAGVQMLYRSTPLGPLAYVPRGPVADLNNLPHMEALWQAVHERARARGCFFLKVEPNLPRAHQLLALGFRPSPQTIQPRNTLTIDLTPDLAAVASQQKAKTRYNIGLAARRGVTVRPGTTEDIPLLQNMMAETGRRDGFPIRTESYYRALLERLGTRARLILAEHQGDMLAGIILGIMGTEAIYLYGASSNTRRNLMSSYLLQWEAMKLAKAEGCTRYDMWGIPANLTATASQEEPPEAEEHQRGDLWGVYRFKRGFGGQLVSLAGAFDYVYRPARYWLWERVVPRLRAMLRRGLAD